MNEKSLTSLRIISGKWKRSKIDFITKPGLRPTGDRLRVTLFNWLMNEIVGAHCLDLFAGSGILGMEALSRNAASTLFVEKDKDVCQYMQQHLARLKAENYQILCTDAFIFLKKPDAQYLNKFNLIFLDPPFHQDWMKSVCVLLEESHLLAPGAFIYLKIEREHGSFETPTSWHLIREMTTQQTQCYLYRHTP